MLNGLRFALRPVREIKGVLSRIRSKQIKRNFKKCGSSVRISKGCEFIQAKNISIGNDVDIGQGTMMMAAEAPITIGNKVMLSPRVALISGDHNISVLGEYMIDVREKRPNDDQEIFIEDDVWIGTGAVILKGVVIGRGSVVAAMSLVTRNVKPYTVVGGVPASFLWKRFSAEQIILHEEMLARKHSSHP